MKRAEWRWREGKGGVRSEWIIEGHRRECAHSCRLIPHLVRRWPLPLGTVSLREERWKEEGRQAGGEKRREGRSDAQSGGSGGGEESAAGRDAARNDGKQTGQKGGMLEMCGGVADKCATRQEMRFIVFKKKKKLMICILMLWQLPFHKPARNTCWFCSRWQERRLERCREWVRKSRGVVGSSPETKWWQNYKLRRTCSET